MRHPPSLTQRRVFMALQIALALALLPAQSVRAAEPAAGPMPAQVQELVDEAIRHNPEIAAAAREKEAAAHRIAPAGALDDPMVEAGLLNVPTESWRLNREDMTMKMLGISQRLPYPGKRALREDIARSDAESVARGYRETVNRVAREVRVTYYDLAQAERAIDVLERNRALVGQLLGIAEGRYAVGQGAQVDVLKAQTQLAKMDEELVRMQRERFSMQADLARALGRTAGASDPQARLPALRDMPGTLPDIDALRALALRERPQLQGLRAVIDRNQKSLDLARKDYYPDFDVRFQYGQRENMTDGMRRTDLFSLTVAFNLPVWGTRKIEPKIAEAQAMREQALAMYQAQEHELLAKLRQQIAVVEQSRTSAQLYETGILPQARLALESAQAAYRVNRVDFMTLLDSQMTLLAYELNQVAAIVSYNKALAEIDQLTGQTVSRLP